MLREPERRGSVARTAEAPHLTPSAVSRQLAALEPAGAAAGQDGRP
ncbi:LysR family transcriptional regulator [Streptomyces avermitilis]